MLAADEERPRLREKRTAERPFVQRARKIGLRSGEGVGRLQRGVVEEHRSAAVIETARSTLRFDLDARLPRALELDGVRIPIDHEAVDRGGGHCGAVGLHAVDDKGDAAGRRRGGEVVHDRLEILRVGRQPANRLRIELERVGILRRRQHAARRLRRHSDLLVEADLQPNRERFARVANGDAHVPRQKSGQLDVNRRGAGKHIRKHERAGRTGRRLARRAARRRCEDHHCARQRASRVVDDGSLHRDGLRARDRRNGEDRRREKTCFEPFHTTPRADVQLPSAAIELNFTAA